MSSSVIFVGAGFTVESVTQVALATLRVRFTQDPVASNPAGANDATNPALYSLVGPGVWSILNCAAVYNDPQAVDLFLAGPLAAGIWTLTASASIHETDGSGLTSPTSIQFTVSSLVMPESVARGALTDGPADILRKHLNPALKGPAWDAIIQAIATGDQKNLDNAKSAFDQLFKSSASGIYLERKAADDGLSKPQNIGMPDDLFRQYSIETTNSKLVESALLKILEVFYGSDSVRARADSGLADTYVLSDGDDLIVLIDEEVQITVTFTTEDFAIIGRARAAEVAASITRAFDAADCNAFAVAITDAQTGTTKVRIYSGSIGLGSSVRVVGGKAQIAFQFATPLAVFSGLPTWNITYIASTNTLRFSPNSFFDMSKVQIGDYATVYGTEFLAANRGTLVITNVYWGYPGGVLAQYFDVVAAGANQAGLIQLAANSLMVFRPTRATIHADVSRAVVVSSIGESVDAVLPATSQAVGRGPYKAAYLNVQNPLAIVSATRDPSGLVHINIPNHGLATGAWVNIDGLTGNATLPTPVAGTHTNGGTSDSSPVTVVSNIFADPIPSGGAGIADLLSDGRVVLGGGSGHSTTEYFQVNGIATDATTGAKTVTSTYTATGALPASTYYYAASSPGGGSIADELVVTGGWTGAASTNDAAIFNSGVWTALPTLAFARSGHAQVTLSDGRVLVMGGYSGGPLNSVERLTVSGTFAWVTMAAMATNRFGHRAILLNNGKVLVIGGLLSGGGPSDISGTQTALCEVYDPTGNTWSATGSMSLARFNHTATLLPDGRVLVAGGKGYNPTQPGVAVSMKTAEIYDPNTGRWSWAGDTINTHDTAFAAYLTSTNEVIVGGGAFSSQNIERYDVASGTWKTSLASMPAAVANPKAIRMANDVVLIVAPATGANVLYIPNANKLQVARINDAFQITKVNNNNITISTPGLSWCSFNVTNATLTPVAAATSTTPGPFVYDKEQGVAVTSKHSTTTETLSAGQRYSYVDIVDATQFPDAPGWLVFSFGYSNQVAPVKYLGRLSNTRLSLDASFRFPSTVPTGSDVTWLSQKGPWVPDHPEAVGSFYITASPAGRIAAQAALADSTAAGVTVNTSITYPGDRGLGGEGLPASGSYKLSDKVAVWGGDDIDAEVAAAREEV